jgi:hypothetical protein
MRFGLLSLCASVPAILACSAATTSSAGLGGGAGACSSSKPLAGASYDVSKSRFAFGSKPAEQQAGAGLVRWVGSDGVVAIFADGSEMASLDGNAPESGLPGWNGDDNALFAHVSAYYEAMGVQSCQIAGPSFAYGTGGSSGTGSSSGGTTSNTTIAGMSRAIEGVVVDSSLASAQFDVNDQTVYEAFYWPEIPADIVSSAVALHTKLADPAQLAAYKAKLPADAQSDGKVIIHHSHAGSMPPFQAAALYTVSSQTSGGPLFFDANGSPVMLTW